MEANKNTSESKKILFVDDEPSVLDAFKRRFNSRKESLKDLSPEYALGGRDAMNLLERNQFDIIVADLKMPDIDGMALLNRAKEISPGTARIILSGQNDTDVMTGSLETTHRYVSKPCDAAALIEMVQRICTIQEKIPVWLRVKLSDVKCSFYPDIVQSFRSELNKDTPCYQTLGSIIALDPCLAARVYQLLYISSAGREMKLTDHSQALEAIGLEKIRSLAFTTGVIHETADPKIIPLLDAVLAHSRNLAVLSKLFAQSQGMSKVQQHQAYLAGLTHEIGTIVLSTHFYDIFKHVRRVPGQSLTEVCARENQYIGVTHAEVGAFLLDLWGFPNEVVDAVAKHGLPQLESDSGSIAAILHHVHGQSDLLI